MINSLQEKYTNECRRYDFRLYTRLRGHKHFILGENRCAGIL